MDNTRDWAGADELLVLLLRQDGRDDVAPAVDRVLEHRDEVRVARGLASAKYSETNQTAVTQ